MKHIFKLYSIALALFLASGANAQITISDNRLTISDIQTTHRANRMDVSMVLDLSQIKIKSNHSLRVTPYLTDGREIMQMPAIIIDGRRRSIVHERERNDDFTSSDIYIRRYNRKEQSLQYEYDVPYEGWMQNAELALREEWCACHDIPYSEDIITIANLTESKHNTTTAQPAVNTQSIIPKAKMAYAIPKQDNSQLQSSTFNIYFPVNKSAINGQFMDNAQNIEQLRKAISASDVKAVKLTGYASPEGPYGFNTNLAQKRAEQTSKYLSDNKLSNTNLTTTSGPIDWSKLREMLLNSYISNYLNIVAIIDDNSIKPEDKNSVIRQRYPVEYNFMLRTWYPKLRTTTITVDHNIKPKSIEEAKATLKNSPAELSLAEIYLIALTYEKGSKEWNDIIILAVENFPNSNEAKVNAANVAMSNGNYTQAAEYLKGLPQDMPEAMNSRGILAMANGNYTEAKALFEKAQKAGISEAIYNLSLLKELMALKA